jgi:hypothetical protein
MGSKRRAAERPPTARGCFQRLSITDDTSTPTVHEQIQAR